MDELIPLNLENLDRMPDGVRVPRYRRADLSAGMVHIGLGNFHRAHQAWYLHRLFDQGLCHDWAIIGAGVRAPDAAQRDRLAAQDWLTTLIELDPAHRSAEIIGSMIDYLPVEEGNGALIAAMADPAIRIVSLTVTEGGYYIDPSSNGFDAHHPDIQHDVANPATPRTAFGAMIEALRLRREQGHEPFSCLSCDNLQGNGAILRCTLVSMANMIDPDLATWIENNSSFPNSMVDCIVPATGPDELAQAQDIGIDDASPVTHENFRQWVVEDDFANGRPAWEKVDVTLGADVQSYESMKLRILNGGHQIVALPGELLGIETIAHATTHPSISRFFHKVIEDEVVPYVASVPDMNPRQYLDLVHRRFSNPKVKDTTRRVAFDGSSRQPGFLFPSIRDGLKNGTSVEGLALATALWCRYCEGTRDDGSTIEPNDPQWSALNKVALAARDDPALWLNQRQYYGDLADNQVFKKAFSEWHILIAADGAEAAMNAYAPELANATFA